MECSKFEKVLPLTLGGITSYVQPLCKEQCLYVLYIEVKSALLSLFYLRIETYAWFDLGH